LRREITRIYYFVSREVTESNYLTLASIHVIPGKITCLD